MKRINRKIEPFLKASPGEYNDAGAKRLIDY